MVNPDVLTWRWQVDNPTLLGWSVVSVYLLSAFVCGRAAVVSHQMARPEPALAAWRCLAALLVFLGINKQLNLQTLLIVLGRRAAAAGGWYEHRRVAQAVFGAAFAVVVGAALLLFASRARAFFGENPFAWRGLVILAAFVLLRAATINHAGDWFRLRLHDDKWAWILEICGSLLLARSALHFIRRARA